MSDPYRTPGERPEQPDEEPFDDERFNERLRATYPGIALAEGEIARLRAREMAGARNAYREAKELAAPFFGIPVRIVADRMLPASKPALYVPELDCIFATRAGYEALKARTPEVKP